MFIFLLFLSILNKTVFYIVLLVGNETQQNKKIYSNAISEFQRTTGNNESSTKGRFQYAHWVDGWEEGSPGNDSWLLSNQ